MEASRRCARLPSAAWPAHREARKQRTSRTAATPVQSGTWETPFGAAANPYNDDHPAAAVGARARQDAGLIGASGLLLFALNDGQGSTEQLACACDVAGSIAAGEQAVMADAVEAFGQDVG